MDKKKDSRLYNKNFIEAWKNAFSCIAHGFKTQRNLKIQLVAGIVVIILGIILKISNAEWAVLMLSVFLVLGTEMMNTAVEAAVDLCTEEYHEKAKIAKDVAAGAVLMVAIISLICGLIIFIPKIINLF